MSIMDDYKQLQAFDRLKDAFKSVEKESTKKYKDALIEIRELAKCISKSTIDTYPYGGDKKTWEAERAEQILDKINEVLE